MEVLYVTVSEKTKEVAEYIVRNSDEYDEVIEICAAALIGLCGAMDDEEEGLGDFLFQSIIRYLQHNWEHRNDGKSEQD